MGSVPPVGVACSPPTPPRSTPTTRSAASRSANAPSPRPRDGWTTVTVKAAALNHHDLWSLRGVGLGEDKLPMILGCDAAGVDEDGNEVVVHAVISSDTGAATRRLTRAARCCPSATRGRSPSGWRCPKRNVIPKPPELSFEHAACLPTAWLTAYRMLFTRGGRDPGHDRARAGRGRRRGHRADRPGQRRRRARVGDQPLGGQARRRRSRSAPSRRSSPAPGCPSASTR